MKFEDEALPADARAVLEEEEALFERVLNALNRKKARQGRDPAELTARLVELRDLAASAASFDLPIAVGILAAMERIEGDLLAETMVAGELSLDGSVMPVRGVLSLAIAARQAGLKRLILPIDNAAEAAETDGEPAPDGARDPGGRGIADLPDVCDGRQE